MDLFILKTWLSAKFGRDDRGASLIEYGLVVTFVAIAAILSVKFIGEKVSTNYTNSGSRL